MVDSIEGNKVILDVFADEGSREEAKKIPRQMFQTAKDNNLKIWTPRFAWHFRVGKNLNINTSENGRWVRDLSRIASKEYGLSVITMGAPTGKNKLYDVDDGNNAPFKTKQEVLEEAKVVAGNAHIMGAGAVRAFSFYSNLRRAVAEGDRSRAIEYMGAVAEIFKDAKLLYVVEPEADLLGNSIDNMLFMIGQLRDSGLENVVGISDLGNLHTQGFDAVAESIKLMDSRYGVGAHVKAYGDPVDRAVRAFQEGQLTNYVPVGEDNNGTRYGDFFKELGGRLPGLNRLIAGLRRAGYNIPGFSLTLEPHIRGAGQFGGWAGPEGMEHAVDGLIDGLEANGIDYR